MVEDCICKRVFIQESQPKISVYLKCRPSGMYAHTGTKLAQTLCSKSLNQIRMNPKVGQLYRLANNIFSANLIHQCKNFLGRINFLSPGDLRASRIIKAYSFSINKRGENANRSIR